MSWVQRGTNTTTLLTGLCCLRPSADRMSIEDFPAAFQPVPAFLQLPRPVPASPELFPAASLSSPSLFSFSLLPNRGSPTPSSTLSEDFQPAAKEQDRAQFYTFPPPENHRGCVAVVLRLMFGRWGEVARGWQSGSLLPTTCPARSGSPSLRLSATTSSQYRAGRRWAAARPPTQTQDTRQDVSETGK